MGKLHYSPIWRLPASGLGLILFSVGSLVLGLFVFPITMLLSTNVSRGQQKCRKLVKQSFGLYLGILRKLGLVTYSVEGEQHLGNPGELIIANHPSLLDIVILLSILPDAKCIVKAELLRNVVTRAPLSFTGYIPNEDSENLVKDCIDCIKGGTSLVVFPEGSRTESGQPLNFKRGAAHIALRSGKPVRLVHITCTPPALRKDDKWYKVPEQPPHLTLRVNQHAFVAKNLSQKRGSHDARALTKFWQASFSKETF